jgi:hypothetical protein
MLGGGMHHPGRAYREVARQGCCSLAAQRRTSGSGRLAEGASVLRKDLEGRQAKAAGTVAPGASRPEPLPGNVAIPWAAALPGGTHVVC